MKDPDVIISKLNEVYMRVSCKERYMELDIRDRFSFEIKNPQFDPRVKKGHWDGIKRLYNLKEHKLYTGLLFELMKFLKKKGLTYRLDPSLLPPKESLGDEDIKNLCEDIIKPVDEDGKLLTPYDYQYESLKYGLNMGKSLSLAATSAGKSLILYLSCRIYQMMEEMADKKIVIIVPTTTLLEQLYSDFDVYSKKSNWNVQSNCQKISSAYSKFIDKQIVITTWQSAAKFNYEFYENVGAVYVDECHTASANELTKILSNCTNTPIRHGFTGTLDDVECNEMVIQGLLGPAKKIVSAKELIDLGRATKIIVRMVVINHNEDTIASLEEALKERKGLDKYRVEVDFVNDLECRLRALEGMIDSVPGNNVVLFDRVEKYGKIIYDSMSNKSPENNFLFTGSVKRDEREEIRLNMEDHKKANIFASFQTFQLGVSIKKLHNAWLISSSKSKIRVLQSLGRLMRKHNSKDVAYIYDVVDNIPVGGKNNLIFTHAFDRVSYYKNEGHPIEFISINL